MQVGVAAPAVHAAVHGDDPFAPGDAPGTDVLDRDRIHVRGSGPGGEIAFAVVEVQVAVGQCFAHVAVDVPLGGKRAGTAQGDRRVGQVDVRPHPALLVAHHLLARDGAGEDRVVGDDRSAARVEPAHVFGQKLLRQ